MLNVIHPAMSRPIYMWQVTTYINKYNYNENLIAKNVHVKNFYLGSSYVFTFDIILLFYL